MPIEAYDGTVILVSHDRALLRALTTRIWILHEPRMTEFAGSFAEWEEVSTERAHAAAVSAARTRRLRQVHEHQRVAPKAAGPAPGAAPRPAGLGVAEARVTSWSPGSRKSHAALEDPALYTRPTAPPRPEPLEPSSRR